MHPSGPMLAFQLNIPEIFSEALASPAYMVATPMLLTVKLLIMYTFEVILFLFQTMLRILSWFMVKTPKQGAQTTIYVAVSEDLKGVSGKVIVLLHR